jgi:hypothetical protein
MGRLGRRVAVGKGGVVVSKAGKLLSRFNRNVLNDTLDLDTYKWWQLALAHPQGQKCPVPRKTSGQSWLAATDLWRRWSRKLGEDVSPADPSVPIKTLSTHKNPQYP